MAFSATPGILHGSWYSIATSRGSPQADASTAGCETESCCQLSSARSTVLGRTRLLQLLQDQFHRC